MDNLEQGTNSEEMIEIDLREYLQLLWRRKWLLIGLVVLAVVASFFISKSMTKIYQTSTMIMVKEDSGVQDLFGEQMSFLAGGSNSKQSTYIAILRSRRILSRVIKELDLRNSETGEYLSTKTLKEMITVGGSADTNMITITVNYPDPVMARDIANTLVQTFQEENQEMNRADLRSASGFISEQLAKASTKLSELEERLLQYKEEHGVIFPEDQGTELLKKLTQLETARTEAELKLAQSQKSLAGIKEHLAEEEREIVSAKTVSKNPVVNNIKSKLSGLRVELAGLQEVYTDRHPEVIKLKREISEMEGMLEETVAEIVSSRTETINPIYQLLRENIITLQTAIISAETQLSAYNQQIAELEKELSSLPEKELALARLQRESKVTENIYLMLMEKQEEIQIQEAMQSSDIVVVDPAVVKENPVKPNTKLNIVIAAFLAIFIGVFVVFLMEYLDRTIKSEKEIKQLTGLPVLGVIPDMDGIDHSYRYGKGDKNGQ